MLTGLHLFALGAICLFVAWLVAGVWVMGMDTYASRTAWILPPLAFAFAVGGGYCWINLALFLLGLHQL